MSASASLKSSASLVRRLSTLDPQDVRPTDAEWKRAEELMGQVRFQEGRRTSGGDFDIKDANPALSRIASGQIPNVTLGLVQALLEWGADPNIQRAKSTSLFKKFSGKDQEDIRSDVLQRATQNCSTDVVHLLARKSDEQTANQVLPTVMRMGDSVTTAILLLRGANASFYCCELFLPIVDSGPEAMVEVLMRQAKGACQICRNKGLVRAVLAGSAGKTAVLMDKGADVSFNGAAALITAIQRQNEDLAVMIASRPEMRKHPVLLDKAVGEAYAHRQYRLLGACLKAGSQGPEAEKALLKAISAQQQDLINLLTGHGVALTTSGEGALILAIDAGNVDSVGHILRGRLEERTLVVGLSRAVGLADLNAACLIMNLLLGAGIQGNATADALVRLSTRSVLPKQEPKRLEAINLLLDRGKADVNTAKGTAVIHAIQRERQDMLKILLRYGPSPDTLAKALETAMGLKSPEARLAMIKIIAETGRVAADENLQRAAMTFASINLDLSVLQYLGRFIKSPPVLHSGFAALITKTDMWMSPKGLYVVQFFLNQRVAGPDVDRAMCQAAVRNDRDAVHLLATSIEVKSLGGVLDAVTKESNDWQRPGNLWLVHRLLSWGARGPSVHQALIYAVREKHPPEALVDTLLTVGFGADVNYQQGEVLKVAVRRGSMPLLQKLCFSGATQESLTGAFHAAISTEGDEIQTLKLLDVVQAAAQRNVIGLNVQAMLADGRPPLVACMSTHPKSVKLLQRLVKLGCDLKCQVGITGEDGKQEWVPQVVWALWPRKTQPISSPVIAALIDASPATAIHEKTSTSGMTPLMVAAKFSRAEIVNKLLSVKANPLQKDHQEITALMYASRGGNLPSVQALVKAKARVNDGSLHEAARYFHADIVATLIQAGHDANFPSRLHDGRTPLQELCLRCTIRKEEDAIRLESTIEALKNGRADVLRQYQSKNALFLALDNRQPIPITMALLDLAMWEANVINNDKNTFVQQPQGATTKFHYSPTMYVRTPELYHGDPSNIHRLLELLHGKHCEDRFYAEFGPDQTDKLQPQEAVGMPVKIREEDLRRRAEYERLQKRERDHQDKMRRDQEEADHKAKITQMQHEQKMRLMQEQKMQQAARNAPAAASPAQNGHHQATHAQAPGVPNNLRTQQSAMQLPQGGAPPAAARAQRSSSAQYVQSASPPPMHYSQQPPRRLQRQVGSFS